MNRLDEQYKGLLAELLYNGVEKEDRTGTGTISRFGHQIIHNMADGFPLLTTKKMAVKTMMTELKWFLKGDTNIKYLVDNKCNIWNGDAFKNYISKTNEFKGDWPDTMEDFIYKIKTDDEFAKKWGELGPIYGHQWRHWTVKEDDSYDGEYVWVDQIKYLIQQLKENPDSRRLMVNAWNVGALEDMVLPPCHYGFQMYTQVRDGKRYLSLMWNQRSVDTFLGLPFNIASYATLLCLIAQEVDMIPDKLIGNLGDTHLYSNHVEQAKEQISRQPYDLPTVKFTNVDLLAGEWDYEIINYQSHPTIKAPLSN